MVKREGSPIYTITEHDTLATPLDTASLQALVTAILDDRKAADIVTLDIKDKSDFADTMVVASGTSSRHVVALAQHVLEALKAAGLQPMAEGMETGEWVLVDAGNVIIHLFHPETRAYYRLEKMWGMPALHQFSRESGADE